jgi:hypothetical protein
MPSVRVAADYGSAIIVGGVVYYRVSGPNPGIPNASPTVGSIEPYSFYYGDDGVVAGAHHDWTACEHGIAFYTPNYKTQDIVWPGWKDLFTAPAAGVIRFWGDWLGFRLNGGPQLPGGGADKFHCGAVSVVLGDVLQVANFQTGSTHGAAMGYLPATYP